MNLENKQDYIYYRLSRAKETFEEATILAENNKWNAVINRLYYASFYAVVALLLKHNINCKTHDGARTQFGLQFVKSGIINKDVGKLYSKLFDYRQKGDYGDLYDYDREFVSPLISKTKQFIDELEKLI